MCGPYIYFIMGLCMLWYIVPGNMHVLCLIIAGKDLSSECKSNSSADPIIAGVIIAIIGVVVGVTGLSTAFVMFRNFKMR